LRRAAGIETVFLDRAALRARYGIERAAALLTFDNLTINPRAVAAQLLIRAQKHGARIYAPVQIDEVSRTRSSIVATDRNGYRLRCKHLVLATGYEFPKFVPLASHRVATTWAFATAPQPRKLWPGACLIWEASSPYLYVRTTADGRVLCGGEDERTPQRPHHGALLERKIARLQGKLGKLFPDLDTQAEFHVGRFVRRDRDRAPDHRRNSRLEELLGRARLWRQRHHLQPDRRGGDPLRADRRARPGRRSVRVRTLKFLAKRRPETEPAGADSRWIRMLRFHDIDCSCVEAKGGRFALRLRCVMRVSAQDQRVKTALDETRLLILGAQVLFGFHFNGAFQSGFADLAPQSRALTCALLPDDGARARAADHSVAAASARRWREGIKPHYLCDHPVCGPGTVSLCAVAWRRPVHRHRIPFRHAARHWRRA
jgi:hypothetical protein